MKTVKKEYETPAITIFQMASECEFLAGSGVGGATYHDRVEEEEELE